jgi:hypothetical protein
LLAKIVAANVILSSLFSLFFEGTSRPDGTPFKYGTNEDESMQRRVTSFYNMFVACAKFIQRLA